MKKFLSLGLAAVLTTGLATSCKDDVLNGGEGIVNSGAYEDDGIRMYFTAAIALPSQNTRSQTEDEPGTGSDFDGKTNSDEEVDYEYGHDYENTIRSVLLVFTNADREFVASSHVTGITKNPDMATTRPYDVTVLGEIKHSDLVRAYTETEDGNTVVPKDSPIVYVYAFCNPTARMIERFEALSDPNSTSTETEDWYNWEGLVEEDASAAGFTPLTQNSIWAENSFLMASAKECEVTFPEKLSDWDNYADKESPFWIGKNPGIDTDATEQSLSPIDVERVAARLDFKDGHDIKYKWEKRPNTYPIFVDSNGDNELNLPNGEGQGGDLNIISVQLNRMCLVNMAKKYYYLRRVSSDGTNKVNAANFANNTSGLLGIEHSQNFVVDVDSKEKKNYEITAANEHEYFNFPLYTTGEVDDDDVEGAIKYNRFGWFTDRIQEDFLEMEPKNDTWEGQNGAGGYKIWRYVTENTMPNDESQQTVQSTGIVFKGRIVTGKDIENPDASKYMSQKVIDAIQTINGEKDGKKFGEGITRYEDLSEEQQASIPYLYSFLNILYAGEFEIIEKANEDGNNGSLYQAVNGVLGHWVFVPDPESLSGGELKGEYIYDEDGSITAGLRDKIKNVNGSNPENTVVDVDKLTVAKWARINAATLDPDRNEGPQVIPIKVGTRKLKENSTDQYEYVYETKDFVCDATIGQNDFRDQAASSQITVYRPYNESEKDVKGEEIGDGWGYYCYYFYWNRHNDNGKAGLMGKMEFATVRNNVYKLYVESIGALGHPRHRIFDPDPVEPDDPDEDPFNYIKVQVKVLPWVVRENKITF